MKIIFPYLKARLFIQLCIWVGMLGFLLSCNDQVAGGSSETENNVSVKGKIEGGNLALVKVRPSQYLSNTTNQTNSNFDSLNYITDHQGNFSIKSLKPGAYTFEVSSKDSLGVVYQITLDSLQRQVVLPTKRLEKMGLLEGEVRFSPVEEKCLVRVPGLERLVELYPGQTQFKIPVPPGNYTIHLETSKSPTPFLSQSIAVESQKSSSVGKVELPSTLDPFFEWKFQKILQIQNQLLGLISNEKLFNYPLLVRLDSNNFDFTQANTSGSDLRILKSDGITSLPLEIERWNPTEQVAEIWVLLDTIDLSQNIQNLYLRYGNPMAISISSGKTVFGKQNQNKATWHLAEKSGSNLVQDATGNFSGELKSGSQNQISSAVHDLGIIGNAFHFKAKSDSTWIDLGSNKDFMGGATELTVSFWFKVLSDSTFRPRILSLSAGVYDTLEDISRLRIHHEEYDMVYSLLERDSIKNTQGIFYKMNNLYDDWYLYTGVANLLTDSMIIYINGVPRKAEIRRFNFPSIDTTLSARGVIGANELGTNNYFSGWLDEVRLEQTARSPLWIKYTYLNQKPKSELVKIY